MAYIPKKTFKKAAPPLIIIIIVYALIGTLQSKGISVDDQTIWPIATVCYSVYIALVNWLKNHKRGDDPFKPIKPV